METLFTAWEAGLTAVSPVGVGFALGFLMWLLGTAIGAIFKAFNGGSGLDSNDE
jgi:hypothetical protein